MKIVLIPLLLLLDLPYYFSRGLGDLFTLIAEAWPPFTEIAKRIWRER